MTNIVEILQRNRMRLALIRKALKICLCICFSTAMYAQQHQLILEITKDETKQNLTVSLDSSRVISYSDSLVNVWRSDGYLNAEVDNIRADSLISKAIIYQGYRYEEFQLDIDLQTNILLQEAGMANIRWMGNTYSHERVRDVMDRILIYLENNGYPFATVKLDSTGINKGSITTKLVVDRKKLVLMDTLAITGDANVSDLFIRRYLDIKAGDPYSLEKILVTKKKISDLPYCRLKSDPIVSFVNRKAVLKFELLKQQASAFDFIIGVLPSNMNGQREFIITGEFKGDLHNELGYGERIYAKFERLKPETQELELKFNLPYLGNLPFGIDTDFGLYRGSTNFLELKSKLGLQYLFSGLDYIDASWYFNSLRLIEIDTVSLIANRRLPSQLDVNYTGGGVGVSIEDVDYRFNPGKGWRGALNSTLGIKSIVANNTIQSISEGSLDFAEAYDTLELNSFQAELYAQIEYYTPIGTWATVKTSVKSAYKYNQERLYDNELFRIGGNRLLRGFDEQSILTDLYAVATVEFRVVLDQNSFLSFPFIDYGRVHSLREGEKSWENTFGTGFGLNFATGAGIFNVSFAIGKRADIPVDFSATKIHFGYVSLF